MPNSLMERHPSLDFLRAIAILYIVGFWHLCEYTGLEREAFNTLVTRRIATVMLCIFVLISGFLCARKPIDNPRDLWRWYATRFWRLYPPFLLACAIFWVMGSESPDRLLHGATLIGIVTDNAPRTLWFIAMLVMFYVLAPVFLLLRRRIWTYIAALIGVMALAYGYDYLTGNLDNRFVLFLPCFVAGILLERHQPKADWRAAVLLIGLWLMAVGITLFIPFEQLKDSPLQIPVGLVSSIGAFLLFQRYFNGRPAPALVLWLSQASFFMYLFHRPIYQFVQSYLSRETVLMNLLVYVLLVLPVTFVICWWAQKGYDRLIQPWVRER